MKKEDIPMDPKRVVILDDEFDGAAIKTALQVLAELANDDKNIRECVLLIPVKGNLQHTTLSAVLGENATKPLSGGKSVRFGQCSLRLETERSFKNYTKADAVLAVYADQRMMDSVDSNGNFKIVICVPHIPEAVEEWVRTWNPVMPGQQQTGAVLIDNPIVEAALESITGRINLGSRILNPRDEEAVKDAFRILRAHNEVEDPKNIRAWCIKNGWDSKGADEAMKHAAKAFNLKSKPSRYGQHWADNILTQWMNKADK
ncbi:hypothetical protein [Vreelandella gomseomensis]|uniref:Uncharacterized protein n=1 Tax=Vreelandella gomseomensis TaxID=370766 RepID=A0ABU1GGA7_9GAMM|nr:hypothetical protein [Halomonas gomseomensis]MDR5876143.1 hypothetical protein [Halomonas gomseomensis]